VSNLPYNQHAFLSKCDQRVGILDNKVHGRLEDDRRKEEKLHNLDRENFLEKS
jgi:hypothetical protein